MSHRLLLIVAAGLAFIVASDRAAGAAPQPALIAISDRVAVAKPLRLGINIGERDPYHDVPLRKALVEQNFEGGLHRRIFRVGHPTADGKPTITGMRDTWRDTYRSSDFTLISGPGRWTSGRITGLTEVTVEHDGRSEQLVRIATDKPIIVNTGDAVLFHLERDEPFVDGGESVRLDENAEVVKVDPHGESFGTHAAQLDGGKAGAKMRLFLGTQSRMDLRGDVAVRFKARAAGGSPRLSVNLADAGSSFEPKLSDRWQSFERTMRVDNVEDADSPRAMVYVTLVFEATGGKVQVDDISVALADDVNPTPFRDGALKAFSELRPGIVRVLQGSDNSIRNTIMPRLRSRNGRGSLHEVYAFCQAIDAEPYVCLPATITREEMVRFMEYLGAPADVGWGRLRAELGQIEPWTKVLPGINIEFGNELYNFGGYGGPDYWHDLIAAAKASPHYDPKVFFTMGHQGHKPADAPNADGHSTATYICWGFTKEGYERYLTGDTALFDWAAAWAWRHANDSRSQLRYIQEQTDPLGIEMVLYEGNFHTNFGSGPSEPRNELVTSLGGGVIYTNLLLQQMQNYKMRKQCFFQAVGMGLQFSGTSAFGSAEAGYVRIWGSMLKLDRDHQRYRPVYHALRLTNQAIMGDMVEVDIRNAPPTFQMTAIYPWAYRDIKRMDQLEPETVSGIAPLGAYAFRDGNRRSLILVNQSSREAIPVRVDARAAEVIVARLAHDDIRADNELERPAPMVEPTTERLGALTPDTVFDLKPMSLTVLRWTEP